ncbi:MAG: PASTA domain-containing protein [Haloechinothrix sp.]
MTRTDATLLGALLDHRYRVTRLLARGGMSTVYRGVDTRLDREVAIKVMHPQFAADRSFVDRFEREARAAAKLHHPHVVAVHDQGVDYTGDGTRAFLVMELVNGGTLRDLMDRQGTLDPALALSVAEHVLSALSVAHQAGLVHRDIKPENVLIGQPGGPGADSTAGVVKVADFGLVRAIASAGTTSSSVILGTVAYLSPEQVTTGAATERSDVYSVGLLLYEMLTGKPAYTGDTAISVAYRHVNDDVPAPSQSHPAVPAELDELVVRATRRDPSARPADAAAFLAELEQVRRTLGLTRVPVPAQPLSDVAAAQVGPLGTRALTRMTPADDDDPTIVQPAVDARPLRGGRRKLALWLLLGLLVAGLAGAGAWVFNAGQAVTVPTVAGMDREQAETVLTANELAPEVVERRHNTVEAGTAMGTDPAAGTELRRGDPIKLIISLGRPTVPDIAPGTSLAEAEAAITEAQLKPRHDPAADAYHQSVPEGAVVAVDPEPGTPLKIGQTVRLGLSKGRPPNPVPDVAGMSKDKAFTTLREAGFEPYDAGEEFSAEVAKGKVVRTDPAKGATPEGDKPRVGVFLSNAVEVPHVVGRPLQVAERRLADAGLQAVVEGGRGGRIAWVVGQNPGEGTRVEPGSKVRLQVFP